LQRESIKNCSRSGRKPIIGINLPRQRKKPEGSSQNCLKKKKKPLKALPVFLVSHYVRTHKKGKLLAINNG